MKTLRPVLLGLVVVAASVICLAAPASARAAFAAIAYSENTGAYGYSYGYAHRGEAEQAALDSCNADDAQVVVWSENAWCALAVSDNGAYGYGYAGSEREAKRIALRECRNSGGSNVRIACYAYSGQ